jgi:hypothetical protein
LFKIGFTSILYELFTLHPYWLVTLLCSDINFHVFITSLRNHDMLMGKGLFFNDELVGFWVNQSLGVNGSVCIFTHCDYQTNCGDMLVKHTNYHSLMIYSLVTTLRESSLYYFVTIFFSLLFWIGCGLGELTCISSFDKRN